MQFLAQFTCKQLCNIKLVRDLVSSVKFCMRALLHFWLNSAVTSKQLHTLVFHTWLERKDVQRTNIVILCVMTILLLASIHLQPLNSSGKQRQKIRINSLFEEFSPTNYYIKPWVVNTSSIPATCNIHVLHNKYQSETCWHARTTATGQYL